MDDPLGAPTEPEVEDHAEVAVSCRKIRCDPNRPPERRRRLFETSGLVRDNAVRVVIVRLPWGMSRCEPIGGEGARKIAALQVNRRHLGMQHGEIRFDRKRTGESPDGRVVPASRFEREAEPGESIELVGVRHEHALVRFGRQFAMSEFQPGRTDVQQNLPLLGTI